MTSTTDRTVHARDPLGTEVARYDKAGKWWKEYASGSRKPLSLKEAVAEAIAMNKAGGVIHMGQPGGGRFDYLIDHSDSL